MSDIFGNVHLGYVVIETDKFADWRRFGRDAIGMHLDEALSDVMRFRLDDNECRFLLQRGPAEDVTALGWQLDDHNTFDEVVSRVSRHGVPVTEGNAEEAALRGVERLVRFPGPNGLAQEIFTRARISDTPLDMQVDGGFVKGVATDTVDLAMVEAVHHVGNIMGIKTVAEWVESQTILSKLQHIGIDYGQGYALGRPKLLALQ